MSRFLVRKAFELLDDGVKSDSTGTKKRKHAEFRTNKKIQKKEKNLADSKKFDISFSMKKSSIEEYKSKHMVDRTDENLKILLQSKQLKPKSAVAQKILEFHDKDLKKREIEPEVETPEPESILFPEDNKKKKRKQNK